MSPFWILLELRVMEVVETTGAIRHAKLQSINQQPTFTTTIYYYHYHYSHHHLHHDYYYYYYYYHHHYYSCSYLCSRHTLWKNDLHILMLFTL